jgi:TolB-like protein/Tfp pilus assembly protein PilF
LHDSSDRDHPSPVAEEVYWNIAISRAAADPGSISRELIYQHLARILESSIFERSQRLARFLQFSVEAALNGDGHRIKEYVIGVEVFDRGQSFDPRIDPVVRVEARRLRARLKQWHETEGRDSAIIIELPTGGYAARFRYRSRSSPTASAAHPAEKTIAVLPFVNLNGDPELDYFSDGLTEELIHALTSLKDLHVVAWPSMLRLKGQDADAGAISEKLNVKNILRGSVRRSGDRLRMTAQLMDAANGHYLWSEAWDRPAAGWLTIEQEIAQAIVDKLRLNLVDERDGALPAQARDTESHTLYLKGRFHWNKRTPEGLQLAISYFKRAAERDPSWPLAWAGLADAHAVLASHSMARPEICLLAAREAAEKALALDPNLAEAVTCLAFIRATYDWEWEEAEALYRQAIALNPNYATAHHWYGSDYLTALGRFDEAVTELETAITLDPLSSITLNSRATVSLVSRDYEDAERQCKHVVQHDPVFYKSWSALGRVYTQMGKFTEACEMFHKARALAGDLPKILGAQGQMYGLAGRPDEARQLLRTLESICKTQYVGPTTFALIHLGLGEREAALEQLENAVDQREQSVTWLKVHPAWDALRPEPRFQVILERLGLGWARLVQDFRNSQVFARSSQQPAISHQPAFYRKQTR